MTLAMIFDVDGTLVDSVDLHAAAWQDAFREIGHDFDLRRIRGQIGKGGDQLLPEFLSQHEIDRIGKDLEARRGTIFKERYMHRVRPFPRVRDLIQRLLDDGIQIALASSAKQEELDVYKQIANIDDLVHTATTADDAEKTKPHPDIFLAALDRLGNPDPAQVLAIGDTPYDAQSSGKAGLRPVGMLCGGWPEQDLRGAGCTIIHKDPAAMLATYEADAASGPSA